MNGEYKKQIVKEILMGFRAYFENFKALTKMAPIHFRDKDWAAMQITHRKRLRLYKDQLKENIENCRSILHRKENDRNLWIEIKKIYSNEIKEMVDRELAASFFNSIIRKTLPVIYVDQELMFVIEEFENPVIFPEEDIFFSYPANLGLEKIFEKILGDFDFGANYLNKNEDIEFLVTGVEEVILSRYSTSSDTTTQVLRQVFFRNKAAYLIGRIFIGNKWMPFLIPFLHGKNGVFADTLIFDPNVMSGIFSFTRSYFMADIPVPAQVIAFLHSIIRQKKIHELYNALGFNKHGKTEFYRDFLHHLEQSKDHFILAEGIKGMVMTVFTLPSYNIVFKLIKDHFDPPKNMSKQEVREKYKLVSLHDRVGRMADTHEFENFQLPFNRIDPGLLTELKNTVNSLMEIKGETLVIKHLYTERRMIPLNLYLEYCTTSEAMQAVEEYGNAILQLAKANIFPGDMMTKNFGVTRQKRVVFYDYDEIEFLEDMNFREKPKAETFDQIYASEPWYEIAKNDVFPEDFKKFMIGREDVKDYFFHFHEKLFDFRYWKEIQKKIREGELIHAFPYPEKLRFRSDEIF